jgi:hypothetical protein
MAEKVPGDPPSRWTVINDYSKTVVTVCAALLALIGAFSSKVIEGQLPVAATYGLDSAIVLLGLAALASLAVPAALDRYLRVAAKSAPPATGAPTAKNLETATQDEWNSRASKIWWIKCMANLSYIFLALAIVGLVVFAYLQPGGAAKDEKTALTSAFSVVAEFGNVPTSELHAESMDYVKATDSFQMVLVDDKTNRKYQVVVPRGSSPISVHFAP